MYVMNSDTKISLYPRQPPFDSIHNLSFPNNEEEYVVVLLEHTIGELIMTPKMTRR